MNTRFYDRPDRRGFGLGLGPVLQAALVGRPPPPNFMPSSTPFFTSCGQAASGDYCHANFRLGARSTITFEPGKTPVCGSIYIGYSTSRPVVMPDEKTVLRGVIMDGQSVKTTERGGARGFDAHKRVKGRKRHILVDTIGLPVANRVEPAKYIRSSCRRSAAWRIECAVSEDPDGNSRCRPREPKVRSNPEAKPRTAATNRQQATTSVQDHGSDMDRGT